MRSFFILTWLVRFVFFILLFLTAVFGGLAQWQPITVPKTPAYGTGWQYPVQQVVFPVSSLVLSNGNIYYSAFIKQSNHYGWGDMFRADDYGNLLTPTTLTANPIQSCCSYYFLSASNDSTYCLFEINSGFCTYKYGNIYGGFGQQGLGPLSHALTNKWVYSTFPGYGDTLKFFRTLISPTYTQSLFKMPKYHATKNCMQFVNDSVGFMSLKYKSDTAKNVLVKTIDFGNTWAEIYFDSLNTIKAFHFPSPGTGYMLKGNGDILKTTNGGNSWLALNSPAPFVGSAIRFVNDSVGYLGGITGNVKKTVNGGNTWVTEIAGGNSEILDFYNFGSIVYLSTQSYGRGLWKNNTKVGTAPSNPIPPRTEVKIYPNPTDHDLIIELIDSLTEDHPLILTNGLGQKVTEMKTGDRDIHLDLSAMPKGLYFLSINTGSEQIIRKVLVIH